MVQQQRVLFWQLKFTGFLLAIGAIALAEQYQCYAQVNQVPDDTLGAERSQVTRNVRVQGRQSDRINGGARRGANLFHSFLEFGVRRNQRVYFTSPNGVRNILTRVTGPTASRIAGTLGVDGSANLFLLNPNGVVFGNGARLDMGGGSLITTTANEILFGDVGSFSASPAPGEALALLTVDPSALRFNQAATQAIAPILLEDNTNLRAPDSQSLLLVGGSINMADGTLRADGGRIELAAIAGASTVGLDGLRLAVPDDVERGDISLTDGTVRVSAGGGGNIAVYARDFTLSDSNLTAGIANGQGTADSRGGDVRLNATRAIAITGDSSVSSEVNQDATGSSGDIEIIADSIVISGQQAQVRTNISSQEPGCRDRACSAGDIVVQANSLELTSPDNITSGGAGLQANTSGLGDAGNIRVNVRGAINISNRSRIESEVRPTDRDRPLVIGDAGTINITAQSLTLTNAGRIVANSQAAGDAGSIIITADTISLIRSGRISSSIGSRGSRIDTDGTGGDITINARSISMIDGGFIEAETNAAGNGGNISVNASESLTLSGLDRERQFRSSISVAARAFAQGQGGNARISAGTIRISDGAVISARTESGSQGGNITIDADRIEMVRGGQIVTSAYSSGSAGSVRVTARDGILISGNNPNFEADIREAQNRVNQGIIPSIDLVIVTDGAPSGMFARTTRESGAAGSLDINTGSLTVQDGAQITASTLPIATGPGGSIRIAADRVRIQNRGEITVGSEGAGQAGNLAIAAPIITLTNSGRISAETVSSSGGNIALSGLNTLQVNNSQISASTRRGVGGALEISATGGTVNLSGTGGLFVEAGERGSAGRLTLSAAQLTLEDNAQISAETVAGTGGDIQLRDLTSLRLRNSSQISASTQGGTGGSVRINANTVQVGRNSRLSATSTSGTGGDLIVNASRLAVSGGSLSAAATTGTAGDLTINSQRVRVQNGAEISVRSPEGQAGNLTIRSNTVLLNDGTLTAETGVSDRRAAANITLRELDQLQIRNGSLISARARGRADGGNITIDAPDGFVIAVPAENSDIIASADGGNGGRIDITTQEILGLEERDPLTELSDINASSEFGVDGVVQINTPEVDPSQGLTELPADVVDASRLIAQNCSGRGGAIARQQSEFVVTGRGGLPLSPEEPLNRDALLTEWVTADTLSESSSIRAISAQPTSAIGSDASVIEAQGWLTTASGDVVLTAQAPASVPHRSALVTPSCNEP